MEKVEPEVQVLRYSPWTQGRFAVGNIEITCGCILEVMTFDHDGNEIWIKGRVEHNGKAYYFICPKMGNPELRTGWNVRIPSN